jgi:hypothetical protein
MAELSEDFDLRWELLVADAWADPQLKAKLLKNPQTVLAERGISLPAGMSVNIHEDSDSSVNLVLPPVPAAEELSEQELETVAGGGDLCISLCCGNGGGGCSGRGCSSGPCSSGRGCNSGRGCSSGLCSSCRGGRGCSSGRGCR